MDRIYSKIVETFESNKQLFVDKGLTPPAVVKLFMGQPSAPRPFAFDLPAVFIDYSVDYENKILSVYLHVLADFMQGTDNITPGEEDVVRYFRFLKLIKQCFKGMKIPPVFGALYPSEDIPVQTASCVYHRITFQCAIHEELDPEFSKYVLVDFNAELEMGAIKES